MKKNIIISLVISIIINVLTYKYQIFIVLGGIAFHFLGSMLFGYIFSIVFPKFLNGDWRKIWEMFYLLMVGLSVLSFFMHLTFWSGN